MSISMTFWIEISEIPYCYNYIQFQKIFTHKFFILYVNIYDVWIEISEIP